MQDEDEGKKLRAALRMVPVPTISLPPYRPPDAAETARIKEFIQQLAQIDSPDFGLSQTMSGSAFAPIAGAEAAGAFVLGNHGMKRNAAFVELVKRGPRALPFLLEAVDDTTPTRLTMKLQGILMWMEFSNEMRGNPLNPQEEKILAALPEPEPGASLRSDSPRSHTVTIGDVCFVIIGQIVGRGYQACRYQPTGGMVINSPQRKPEIAKAVRVIWSSQNPAQTLIDSLMHDYATRGIPTDGAFDYWYVGSYLQVEAAMRLLFYFPRETVPFIARRLSRLQVYSVGPGEGSEHSDKEMEQWAKRESTNEVRTSDFIKAIAWCREPAIQAGLLDVFKRATDADVLLK